MKKRKIGKHNLYLIKMIKNLLINVVSTVIYFLFLIPVGFILKIFGKDYLERNLSAKKKSYWN